MNKLVGAYIAQRNAHQNMKRLVEEKFPLGAHIGWKRGAHGIQSGIVTYHLFGEQLRVENSRTGKTVDIRYSQIVIYDDLTIGEMAIVEENKISTEW